LHDRRRRDSGLPLCRHSLFIILIPDNSLCTRKYKFDLPSFNGPLDLLLHLIDRQELDITTLSLVAVTEQYLAQIERMKEDRVAQLIDFLVVAARLVQIKSRALLPQNPVVLEEEELEEDPAEALLRQLRAYKQFKNAALWLGEREKPGCAPICGWRRRRGWRGGWICRG
jgi:chromatin segregation and condensation protein Rec8/ScpA/Scc1 (kleisin family)